MTPDITLFTGGCRSGKSRLALAEADALATDRQVFVATCQPLDEEMRQRVATHRLERRSRWETVEAPLALPSAIDDASAEGTVVLVDCLTLWVSNVLLARESAGDVQQGVDDLIACLARVRGPVLLVTNEVGAGIVPDNRLARLYRDLVGLANQAVARIAPRVVWVLAGIPVEIKANGVPSLPGPTV
jgi:adenosylcobinamide kinase/adenosylcobinamide-phosphate guanylyltransferase